MRIPKRVNDAWDWAESHGRVTAVILLIPVLAVGALWSPALAAFALGAVGAGLATYLRLARRIARLRAEVDELLRETGRLRHRNTMLASGIVQAESAATQKLLSIPELNEYVEPERRSA
ncbi:hypothetical protein [Thermomonospora amylolytica]|uniref:hypothetical protein n=1 Tax=Thermomonospora amylolytica TaxID=1411117 RepID=UPI000E6B5DF3|nr:hypothetical protein [Thermomonospora amylolytica]